MSNQKIHRRHKKNNVAVPIMILFIAVTFSALAAAVWQLSSPKAQTAAPLELDPSVISQFSSDAVAVSVASKPAASSSEPKSEAKPDQSQSKASSEPVSSAPEGSSPESGQSSSEPSLPASAAGGVEGALPQSERVSSAYFDDAAFIGDSITVGMKLYDVMENADILAAVGIGLDSIFTKQAIKQPDGSMLTVFDALEKTDSHKVYIMLGANSLMSSHDYLIGQYAKIVDEVKARTGSDTIVYVQSVLPINEPLFRKNYPKNTTTNEDINSFNQKLCKMAAQKGTYYLDVASVFKDDSGALSDKVTSDGMHISSDQYVVWIDYLKTHAVSAN